MGDKKQEYKVFLEEIKREIMKEDWQADWVCKIIDKKLKEKFHITNHEKDVCKHKWIGTSEAGIVQCSHCNQSKDLRKEKNEKRN